MLNYYTNGMLNYWHLIRKLSSNDNCLRVSILLSIVSDIGFDKSLMYTDDRFDEVKRIEYCRRYARLFNMCVELLLLKERYLLK